MFISIHLFRFYLYGAQVEIHKFNRHNEKTVARRVYHPINHAWLECENAAQLRRTAKAISRNVRIAQEVSKF